MKSNFAKTEAALELKQFTKCKIFNLILYTIYDIYHMISTSSTIQASSMMPSQRVGAK